MKKVLGVLGLCLALVLGFTSCGAATTTRVESGTIVADNDEFWNDADIQLVCKSLIDECVQSPRIARFETQNGRLPYVVLGKISNESTEHIDTTIISTKMQSAIINSGVVEFVADSTEREQLRAEVDQQADNASEETAKERGQETGADFMLEGSVKSDVQQGDKNITRSYYVTVKLIDLQSHSIIWQQTDDQVKKVVARKKVKL